MATQPPKTPRTCSQCGNNGHNARTCTEISAASTTTTPPHQTPPQPIFIFGVNISESPPSPPSPFPSTSMRKSMSMNNMYEHHHHHQHHHDHHDNNHHQQNQNHNDLSSNSNDNVVASGYVSDDAIHVSPGNRTRERKRGIPWTEDEHRLFLVGLDKVGKGDWRGIARNYVKTRTPTQVASHAQKYFLRRTNVNRRRRRSSLFDITTDSMTRSSSDSQLASRDTTPYQNTPLSTPYPPPLRPISTKQAPSIPTLVAVPPSSKMASLNLNQSPNSSPTSSTSNYSTTTKDIEYEPLLALKLSQTPSSEESSNRARSPPFGGFNGNGDSIISVA